MKNKVIKPAAILVVLSAAAGTGWAEETNAWRRIGLSYRPAFNISGKFSGLGGFAATGNPGGPGRITGASGTIVRTYDDGFIGIDSSGNANQHTTFWGYDDAAQVVGGTIQMHSSSSSGASTGDVDDGPQHGIELNYFQPLGCSEKWSWGIEGALNWTHIEIKDDRTLSGNVRTVTHAFSLDGVTPPFVPPAYVGPIDGPGAPQLNDNATDVSGPPDIGAASVSGTRKIDANLYGIRVGPYLGLPLGGRFSVALSAGLSLGLVDSEFSFNDTITTSSGTQTRAGSNQSSDLVYGGYVRGQVNVRLWRSASVFAGAEFNSMTSFDQSAAGAKARLDLSEGVYVSAGLSVSF